MKTVKEVAELLNVSYQTVYNHMNKNEVEMIGCIFKKLGTTHINQDGIDILKKSMGLIQLPTVKENIDMEQVIEMISDRVADTLKGQMEEVKDEVIKVSEGSSKDYESLKSEIELLKEQNELLLKIINEMNSKKSIFNLFKSKDKS